MVVCYAVYVNTDGVALVVIMSSALCDSELFGIDLSLFFTIAILNSVQ